MTLPLFRIGLFVLILPNLMGCAGAWVVSQSPDGGVIGYHKGDQASGAEAPSAVKSLIPCANYQIVKDEVRSGWSPGSGNGQATRESATQWNELSYACQGGTASDRSVSSVKPRTSVSGEAADEGSQASDSLMEQERYGRPARH